jgi:hypothetical protein
MSRELILYSLEDINKSLTFTVDNSIDTKDFLENSGHKYGIEGKTILIHDFNPNKLIFHHLLSKYKIQGKIQDDTGVQYGPLVVTKIV